MNSIFYWDQIQSFLSNVIFIILFISTIWYWGTLYLFNKNNFLKYFGKLCSVLANFLLVLILGSRWIISGYFPLSNLYESLLFLTWILLTIYLYIEYKFKNQLIGSILLPLALSINGFTNLTLSSDLQKATTLVPALQSNWLMMHVSMMMLSYGTLLLGSLLSILFLLLSKFQEIDLESMSKYSDRFFNMLEFYYPSKEMAKIGKIKLLQNLDNWSYRIIGFGFPLLTIGIIAGGIWANEAWGSYWSWDPKETWALITWFVFASYLHARLTKGWEGKKTAVIGSIGFFIIWICYLGVNFLGQGLHSYGWLS